MAAQAEKKDAGEKEPELKYRALRFLLQRLALRQLPSICKLSFLIISVRRRWKKKRKDDFYKIIFRDLVIITQGILKT